jgi:hypothetical protein
LKAKSQFEQLIEGLSEKNAVSSVTEAWIARSAADRMGAAVILRLFTHELIEAAAAETVPVPDMAIVLPWPMQRHSMRLSLSNLKPSQ